MAFLREEEREAIESMIHSGLCAENQSKELQLRIVALRKCLNEDNKKW